MEKKVFSKKTTYQGIEFRSRSEARWAIFFNCMGIIWYYEPKKYKFKDGTVYIPDFYCKNWMGGAWFEVKPNRPPLEIEKHKAELLSNETKKDVYILNGDPYYQYYKLLFYTSESERVDNILDWCSVMFCGGNNNNLHVNGRYVDPFDLEMYQMWNDYEDILNNPKKYFFERYVNAVEYSINYKFED
jgi:hypothetical protein